MRLLVPQEPNGGRACGLASTASHASRDLTISSTGLPLLVREQIAVAPSAPVQVTSVKVVFMLSGGARVHSRAGEVSLGSGSILTIPAGVACRGFPAGHARTVTFYIHPEYLADQVRWLSTKHPLVHHLRRALEGDPALHSLQLAPSAMHDLSAHLVSLSQSSNRERGEFEMLSIASEIFDAVGRLSGVPSGIVGTMNAVPQREVASAIALLRADLGRHWRIDELAREVAVSPSHLARLFRAQVGISPAAFLRQLRADQMAELLATTCLTVSEAGAAVGWKDAAVASRSFKQRYGIAPRDYASWYRDQWRSP